MRAAHGEHLPRHREGLSQSFRVLRRHKLGGVVDDRDTVLAVELLVRADHVDLPQDPALRTRILF
jgi:hypothetical protein